MEFPSEYQRNPATDKPVPELSTERQQNGVNKSVYTAEGLMGWRRQREETYVQRLGHTLPLTPFITHWRGMDCNVNDML